MDRWSDDRIDDLARTVDLTRSRINSIPEKVAAQNVMVEGLVKDMAQLEQSLTAVHRRLDEWAEDERKERRSDRRTMWAAAGAIIAALIGAVTILLSTVPT